VPPCQTFVTRTAPNGPIPGRHGGPAKPPNPLYSRAFRGTTPDAPDTAERALNHAEWSGANVLGPPVKSLSPFAMDDEQPIITLVWPDGNRTAAGTWDAVEDEIVSSPWNDASSREEFRETSGCV
jgi:hypothetical protein